MGEFETLVLLAVLRLGNRAYGMEIREEIERRTRRAVSYGAVYTALDRLERKGFVSFDLGDPTPERGGKARKYFRVGRAGAEALRNTRHALGVMWEGVTL
jgi:DNA-binding PadR family transcriptional regulator